MIDDRASVEAALARIRRVTEGWGRGTPVAQMRADWDALFPAGVDAAVASLTVASRPAVWVTPPGAASGCVLLYLHGGGFRVGSCASHLELMAALGAAAGCRVLGLDYRLAPEHAFPASQEDTLAAWQWLVAQGCAPQRLAVAGDSAGGGLVLSLLLALRDRGQPMPAAAVTMSAWTDLSAGGESYTGRAAADPLHQRAMLIGMAQAVLGGADAQDPRASPLHADLHGLPRLLMQVGEDEVVLSDTTDFAAKARAAGVEVEVEVWPGMFHVFQQFPGELASARQARASIGAFLRRQLLQEPSETP
jgi:epsilon-lactone hydrolase